MYLVVLVLEHFFMFVSIIGTRYPGIICSVLLEARYFSCRNHLLRYSRVVIFASRVFLSILITPILKINWLFMPAYLRRWKHWTDFYFAVTPSSNRNCDSMNKNDSNRCYVRLTHQRFLIPDFKTQDWKIFNPTFMILGSFWVRNKWC